MVNCWEWLVGYVAMEWLVGDVAMQRLYRDDK